MSHTDCALCVCRVWPSRRRQQRTGWPAPAPDSPSWPARGRPPAPAAPIQDTSSLPQPGRRGRAPTPPPTLNLHPPSTPDLPARHGVDDLVVTQPRSESVPGSQQLLLLSPACLANFAILTFPRTFYLFSSIILKSPLFFI